MCAAFCCYTQATLISTAIKMAATLCCPFGLRLFEAAVAPDNNQRRFNHGRLRQAAVDDNAIHVFCSHNQVGLRVRRLSIQQ